MLYIYYYTNSTSSKLNIEFKISCLDRKMVLLVVNYAKKLTYLLTIVHMSQQVEE